MFLHSKIEDNEGESTNPQPFIFKDFLKEIPPQFDPKKIKFDHPEMGSDSTCWKLEKTKKQLMIGIKYC